MTKTGITTYMIYMSRFLNDPLLRGEQSVAVSTRATFVAGMAGPLINTGEKNWTVREQQVAEYKNIIL